MGQLTLRTDDGGRVVAVAAGEKTAFLRTEPGATSLNGAVPAKFAELAVGDRVLARGTFSGDRSLLTAQRVVLMTRADITARREQERQEWKRRGVVGVVVSVDPDKQSFGLRVRSAGNPEELTVSTANGTVAFKRYATDSVKFSDARPSTLGELRAGDQAWVLGKRGDAGAPYVAESVVAGAFQTLRGTVASVDAERAVLVLGGVDADPKRRLSVAVGKDAVLRRLPANFGAGRGNLDDVIERLPAIAIKDLTAGEAVAVLSTKGADPTQVTAIKLVAGLPTEAAARGRRGGATSADLGMPPGVLDFFGSLPW